MGLRLVCGLAAASAVAAQVRSPIDVEVKPGGPVTIATARARFEVDSQGYVRGFLLKGGARLSLDDPLAGEPGESVIVDGSAVKELAIDFGRVRVAEARGVLGRGKRVEIPARSRQTEPRIERTAVLEIYEDFPQLLVSTITYKNAGKAAFGLDRIFTGQHRFNARLTDGKAEPYQMWSFQGASAKWGLDDVVRLSREFSRENVMGPPLENGFGGGIPVAAFWTARAGAAVGHLDTLPLALSMPVSVAGDGGVRAELRIDPGVRLRPGESYASPAAFLAVYEGDFYGPLRMYSLALQRRGWKLPEPNREDYAVSWCGWGYGFNVTAKDMLGAIPKLKEYGIHWATLDDRWFDTYGDWNPRSDTFPGDSIRKMVEEYHRSGILVQIWWLPIGAEIPGHRSPSHAYIESKVAREHPDWLVLDKSGRPAIIVRDLATLCPALPEVQQHHKRLTERFIRDWGFDGHKLDNIYSVPPCYNPKHRHKSPYDSVNAMGEVYRAIFETTRALKPQSVTQSCPCGTPPSVAWLPYMDQAVTADPVGSMQVRRRVKMYKALLGPRAAVYGDHVELTGVLRSGRRRDGGRDFASSVGTGAVVGTKFVWPQTDSKYRAALTPEKDRDWKKWMDIYHDKMLSGGEFRNLYVIGYDDPEGYAIEVDGKMYYAFYTPYPDDPWKGRIELRGLAPGKHRVFDYVNGRELGTVDAKNPWLEAEFTGSLLIEASR